MYKGIIIKQPAGLGDIFFTQKIAHFLNDYYKCQIIWPVLSEFNWIGEYIKTPFINFVDINTNFSGKDSYNHNQIMPFEFGEYLVIPLQTSDWHNPNISVMEAKYKFLDLDFQDWKNYFSFQRNTEKENELYYNILSLKDDSNYIFINRKYGSPGQTKICEHIDISKFSNFIEMDYIDGYTLFDWCKVIENAKSIHTVDTSINYIMENMKISCELQLYSRFNPADYKHIKNIFKLNWNYNK